MSDIHVSTKQNTDGSWSATAICGRWSTSTTSIKERAAAYESVQSLFAIKEAEPESPPADEYTHEVTKGRKAGHKCVVLERHTMEDDTIQCKVRYDDGTPGEEGARFLRKLV